MGFFKRATNIATWMLIRDSIREYMKQSAKNEAEKDRKKRWDKLQKEKEKLDEKEKLERAKRRELERDKARKEFENRWDEIIREKYHESLKQYSWMWWPVERCEIKEWKKIEIKWNVFPEDRLKFLDEWSLIISSSGKRVEFLWKVRTVELFDSSYSEYTVYDNGILFYRNRVKNDFFKINYVWNDKENIELLLSGIPYMQEDEDTDYIYQIIDFVSKKNYSFSSEEVADLLGVDDEEAMRLIEKLWNSAWLTYYRNWEEEKSELEKMDEKLILKAEKKEKIKKRIKKFWKIILRIFWIIFGLLFLLMFRWLMTH